MIFVYYGPDTYRMKRQLKEVVAEYKKKNKSSFNFQVFEEKEINFNDLREEFLNISIFKEKKLFVLLNVFSNSEFKEGFLKQGEVFEKSDNILILCQEGEIPANDKLFNFLKGKAKIEYFNLLSLEKVKIWAKKEIEAKGAEIESNALGKLIDFTGNDLWRLEKEIDKLINYAHGKKIKEKDVEELVSPVFNFNIFATIDAIAQKEKKKAARLIRHHLEGGDSPSYILSMISYQLKNLISVKGLKGKNLNQLKMPSFVLRRSIIQAEQFSLEELKGLYQKILDLDLSIKTGKIAPEIALDLFIFDI